MVQRVAIASHQYLNQNYASSILIAKSALQWKKEQQQIIDRCIDMPAGFSSSFGLKLSGLRGNVLISGRQSK